VIDQQGRVVQKHIGPITAAQLSGIIDPLLSEASSTDSRTTPDTVQARGDS
jgi:hypothetical protein